VPRSAPLAVDVRGLVVRYGDVVAVDGLSLWAEPGEVLALLGPNGAGKTSTVVTVEGYRRPAAGTVRVLGLDPVRDRRALAPRLGVMLQRGGVYPAMRPVDALRLFASYYEDPADPGELLARVGLEGRPARTPWRRLSGGEQQRVSLALALVGRPDVVLLDEPTAGMDPAARLLVRQVVRDLRDGGACVVLTTHALEEAERLADRVAIVDRGRLAVVGSVAELTAGGGDGIRFGAPAGLDTAGLAAHLNAPVAEEGAGEYRVDAAATPATVAALTAWLAEQDLPLADLRATRHRLEDVYLRVTSGTAPAPVPTPEPPAAVAPAPAVPRPGAGGRAFLAQARAELEMTLRRGESLLLSLGIPVLLLLFFSAVDVLPIEAGEPVDFLAPGVLALAVMSTAMVGLGIATGFERQYGVLKRLGTTPLTRPALLGAKTAAVLAVEALQVAVLVPVAYALGWRPSAAGVATAVAAMLLGTVAFAGLGLLMAGAMRAEAVLAGANGLYLVLLLLGGMVVPLAELPGAMRAAARALPAASLSDLLHAASGDGAPSARAWLVLGAWAVAAPAAAARTFRWE
jgi:ABC-2 type transport system ATP-binding protein